MSGGLPWFPFEVMKWLTSRKRRRLTWAQQGIYVLLLCEEWDGGPLTSDTAELARSIGADHGDVIAVLSACFNETPKGWVNGVLEDVRTEQLAKIDAHRRAGREGAKAKWRKVLGSDGDAIATPIATPKRRSSSRVEVEVDTEVTARPTRKRAKKAETELPEGWHPTAEHRARAKASGIDCDRLAEKFKTTAVAKGTRYANWNAAFTTWLLREPEFRPNAPPPDSEAAKHDRESEEWRDKRAQVSARTAGEIARLNASAGTLRPLRVAIPTDPSQAGAA